MISLIVCSINKEYAEKLEQNIRETIGVQFELIVINNKIESRGITAVYNQGANQAQYEILVFVHEDVAFLTQDWGLILQKYYTENKDWGVIGIAGAKYKSKTNSGWYTGIQDFDCCNITHVAPNSKIQKILLKPQKDEVSTQVVVLDGVFIVTLKAIWDKLKFNDEHLTGFHYYDIDFSLRAALITKVIVTFEIDIAHFTTGGDFGDKWVGQSFKWSSSSTAIHNTPLSLKGHLKVIDHRIEKKIMITWLLFLMKQPINISNRLKWVKRIEWVKLFSISHYIISFLLYRKIKSLNLTKQKKV